MKINKSSEQKIILFDIDRTLLNTDIFVQNIKQLIKHKSLLSDDVVDKKFENYKKSLDSVFYFDFLDLLETFDINNKTKSEIVKEYEENSKIYPLYPEVYPVLNYLRKKKILLGIFSEGTPRFQINKLNNLNINKYLKSDLVFIGQSKRLDAFIAKIPPGSYIVDDNPEIINHLIKYKHLKPIFLNRNPDQIYNSPLAEIINIKSLDELRSLF